MHRLSCFFPPLFLREFTPLWPILNKSLARIFKIRSSSILERMKDVHLSTALVENSGKFDLLSHSTANSTTILHDPVILPMFSSQLLSSYISPMYCPGITFFYDKALSMKDLGAHFYQRLLSVRKYVLENQITVRVLHSPSTAGHSQNQMILLTSKFPELS